MNKGECLPDTDHVTRYVSFLRINPSTGLPSGAAFERGPKDHDGPSFNWVEYFGLDTIEDAVEAIRDIFENEKEFDLGARAIFALLHIGTTATAVSEETKVERGLAFIYDPIDKPNEKDPSHVIVPEIKLEDEVIAEVIAETVIGTFPARRK